MCKYICMYKCIYVYTHCINTHVFVLVGQWGWPHLHMCIYICIYRYTYVYTYKLTHVHTLCMQHMGLPQLVSGVGPTYPYMYIHMYTYIHIHVFTLGKYIHVVCPRRWVGLPRIIFIYTYTFTYIYIFTLTTHSLYAQKWVRPGRQVGKDQDGQRARSSWHLVTARRRLV